jgi:hypothetical protein
MRIYSYLYTHEDHALAHAHTHTHTDPLIRSGHTLCTPAAAPTCPACAQDPTALHISEDGSGVNPVQLSQLSLKSTRGVDKHDTTRIEASVYGPERLRPHP